MGIDSLSHVSLCWRGVLRSQVNQFAYVPLVA